MSTCIYRLALRFTFVRRDPSASAAFGIELLLSSFDSTGALSPHSTRRPEHGHVHWGPLFNIYLAVYASHAAVALEAGLF